MRTIRGNWPIDKESREVRRFLWFPKTIIRRTNGTLSETRWLETATWKQEAFVMGNGKDYWWIDLHWVD